MTWASKVALWVTVTDAVTGQELTFAVDHIAVFRSTKGGQTDVVLPCGLAYTVEESRSAIIDAITKARQGVGA